MATYTGTMISGGVVDATTADPLGQHFDVARSRPVFGIADVEALAQGTKTDTQPITERALTFSGMRLRAFEQDYYDRMHFSTLAIDLGNVISQQTQVVTIWNSYYVQRSLSAITDTGADGIDLTRPRLEPTNLLPLEEVSYSFVVGTDGPGLISAAFAFDFDVGTYTITIVGSRILPWLFEPDGEILERLEWLTDVIRSYSGNEQRVQLRGGPRRWFEYNITLTGSDRRKAENLLFVWQARSFALPVWFDGAKLAGSLSIGDTSITVDTTDRDYHAGGIVILTTGIDTFEIADVLSVSAGSITLARPLEANWPTGTSVYPVRIARLPEQVRLQRFTGDAAYGRLRWQCDGESANTAATEATTHRSYPVLTQQPNWIEDLAQDYVRNLAWLDNRVSGITVDDEPGLPILLQTHRWLLDGRSEIGGFREWLYARKGRLAAFWMPSWANDLEVVTNIGALATNIDVAHVDYTKQVAGAVGRRDIRIELVDGTVFYRHISTSTEVSSTVERLTIDSALGQLVTVDQIRSVSFMALVRLDSDAAEIAWWRWDVAEAAITVRSATNDL